MKSCITLLLILFSSVSIFAQNNLDDYNIGESHRAKTSGIALLVGGTLMIGGGAAMISNQRSDNAKVAGAVLAAAGVGIDVLGVFSLKKSKTILEEAHKTALLLSPNGIQLTVRF